MVKFALLVRLKAKEGRELAVENFITKALPLAIDEPATKTWYALKIDSSTFGIFDTFEDEAGREAHLGGKIAAALMANAPELLAEAPVIEKVNVLASKMPK
ncbi:MAG: antibiotic biosynthesis monooxygenase [Aureispira sp.]|nr:antibiotic biosynthesis monooxygenase [Aureispira sp.]